ncbi:MAG: hypothetical protein ABR909_13690 [Candidatus Bathyarchaeia archaeon]|jgi:hypothetical protein
MTDNTNGKDLPTTEGKPSNKKAFIIKYRTNNPQSDASEIAQKIGTSVGYVWKVLSQARKPSKFIRGRSGRIFAHGKLFYEWWVTPSALTTLKAPVINSRTGMKQIGSLKQSDPCSCQIHPNGHLIFWPHSSGWREWLSNQLTNYGWKNDLAQLITNQATLNVNVVEGGVKPGDPTFLPKDLLLQMEWGAVLVRDDTPEKGVLELKLSVPDMQRFLGLPDIKKRLEVIEQGSMTHAQSQKTIEALLISLIRLLQTQNIIPHNKEEETNC